MSTERKLKPENLLQCGGRAVMKHYDENNRKLTFMLGVFKMKRAREEAPNEYTRDFPIFVMEGDAAEAAAGTFEVGDNLTVVGHVDTETYMRHVTGNNFQQRWRTVLVADLVGTENRNNGFSSVTLAGEILRVYRNPAEGHRFYMLTIRTGESKDSPKVNIMYFDQRMELEPKVGDFVNASGIIQTKREPQGNGRSYTLISVVSRFLVLERNS